MTLKEILERTAARKAAGINQEYPGHRNRPAQVYHPLSGEKSLPMIGLPTIEASVAEINAALDWLAAQEFRGCPMNGAPNVHRKGAPRAGSVKGGQALACRPISIGLRKAGLKPGCGLRGRPTD